MNTQDTVLDYELENYFVASSMDTYDDREDFFKKARAKRKEKLASMTDEERTARRKKFQKILKMGGVIGAVVGGIAFGPQLIAMLGPTFPAMKTALSKQGMNVKNMKKGEIIKTFFEKVVKGKVEGDSDEKKGMGVVKGILEFFKNAKARKDRGEATALDTLILDEADKTTKKLFNATEGSEEEVLSDVINSGTADETNTTKRGKTTVFSSDSDTGSGSDSASGSGSGMDMKSYLPVILIAVAVLFFMKK